jgi:hypothetical protein
MVAAGVPARGLKGGWRDCCIVNAPERSGSGGGWDYGFDALMGGSKHGRLYEVSLLRLWGLA